MNEAVVPLPKGFRREVRADRLVITWPWRANRSVIFIFLFTIAWDAFLIVWYEQALTTPDRDWMMILFPVLHVAAGFFLTYYCIAALFNSTTVEVSADLLRVASGPVPWGREIRLRPALVRDVIYREHVNKGYSSTHSVLAVTAAGEETLLKKLPKYEHTIFYVRELRAILNLPDRPLSPEF